MRKNRKPLNSKLRKRLAEFRKNNPPVQFEEQEYLEEINASIAKWKESEDGIRNALRTYADNIDKDIVQFDKPSVLLRKLKFDDKSRMSTPYKIIRAVYFERKLHLKAGEIPYSVLSSLPIKDPGKIWDRAMELKGDRVYPSENDVAQAKKTFKTHSSEETMAAESECPDDIHEDKSEVGGEANGHLEKAMPDLRRDILELSRKSSEKTEIMVNILEHLEITELTNILAVMQNLPKNEIKEMINQLKKGCPVVINSKPVLAAHPTSTVSKLHRSVIRKLAHNKFILRGLTN